jgi:DNA-directed RNA polymerase subunit beta'
MFSFWTKVFIHRKLKKITKNKNFLTMDTINKKSQIKVNSIQIGVVSSQKIKQWAERTLPNGKKVGQVITSQTLNYKTLKPYPGGLFCERTFGPIKDFICACGRKKYQTNQKFCPDCEVEYTLSRVRRYRLGFIELAAPVTHIWYLKTTPNYLALILDMSRKQVEALAYCTESIKVPEIELEKSNFLKFQTFLFQFVNKKRKKTKPLLVKNFFQTKKNFSDEKNGLKYKNLNPCQKTKFFEKQRLSNKKRKFPFFAENKLLADFYCISKNFSAETETDWDSFISYMESTPLQKDFCVAIYKNFLHRTPLKESFSNSFTEKTGAEALYILLSQIDLILVEKQLRYEFFELNEKLYNLYNKGSFDPRKRKQIKLLVLARWKKIRRLKVISSFKRTLTRPEWMVLTVLPVLPPDLRPAIPINGNLMISDLNSLYKLVLDRNRRVKEAKEDTPETRKMRLRLLQEAVDSVIENGKGGIAPVTDKANKRPLKSLADLLKGKQGRFRENLLGKRVDYSGRSVIVVGPFLKIHECGIPKEMAVVLFQPFLIRQLLKKNLARTIVSAKRIITNRNDIIWKILENILETHPVFLNRAPTLHRLNIQAFQAKLVDGKAILLHPLVCTAFNADFDGDQMGVHVPLSSKARAEAWSLMWSRNNLLSPATGQPILLPTQDMVLGCYYATTTHNKMISAKQLLFNDIQEIYHAYEKGELRMHCWAWVRWHFLFENSFEKEKPVELRIDIFGNFLQIYSSFQCRYDRFLKKNAQYIRTTPGRILFNNLLLSTLININTTDSIF